MPDVDLPTQIRIAKTALAVLLPWLIRAFVMRAVKARTKNPASRYQWRKVTQYLALASMLAGLGRVWLDGLETVTTVLGLIGAGLAVALNQPIANMAAWLLLVTRRPFEAGDRIEIGKTRGDVVDIGLFQLTLMEIGNWVDAEQSTGRLVQVPNAKIFTEEVANYSRGFKFLWTELPVLITFESDWRKAKTILLAIAEELTGDAPEQAAANLTESDESYMVKASTFTPIVYTKVKDSGVLLTIRMLAPPRGRRGVETALWEKVLDAFADDPTLEFAYPTHRLFGLEEAAANATSDEAPRSGRASTR